MYFSSALSKQNSITLLNNFFILIAISPFIFFVFQTSSYLNSSLKKMPRFSASASEQKYITGATHLRIVPRK